MTSPGRFFQVQLKETQLPFNDASKSSDAADETEGTADVVGTEGAADVVGAAGDPEEEPPD